MCGKSFTTYEAPNLAFLKVKTSSGRMQPFSRAKLFLSLYDAFQNIPHQAATIDAVTDTIESKLLDLEQPELSPANIVSIALVTLKHFNTAAYLRYLSAHTDLASSVELKRALRSPNSSSN
jgi:transcriptional regulator NrdR family protein